MDRKVKKYENILIKWLEIYSKEWTDSETEYQLICDKERHIYQLLRMGWDKKRIFRNATIFHFQIKPETGKVWIYANNTDQLIATEFEGLGIPAKDIVLGFVPEEWRSESGYAVM